MIITASAVNRGPKRVDLKAIVDEACHKAAAAGYRDVSKVLVFEKSALPRWVAVAEKPVCARCCCVRLTMLTHSV